MRWHAAIKRGLLVLVFATLGLMAAWGANRPRTVPPPTLDVRVAPEPAEQRAARAAARAAAVRRYEEALRRYYAVKAFGEESLDRSPDDWLRQVGPPTSRRPREEGKPGEEWHYDWLGGDLGIRVEFDDRGRCKEIAFSGTKRLRPAAEY